MVEPGGATAPKSAPVEGRLPNFLIIGTTKGGTTSLHQYLAPHPDVYLYAKKEPHFFDVHYDRGLDWYREHFAEAGAARAVGEKTPEYLAHPEAASRIAAAVPDAKLVAILRNPIDRAYSHFWMQQSNFPSNQTFAARVEAELRDPAAEPPRPHFRYLDIGLYAKHLLRFDEQAPGNPKLVVTTDELKADPEGTYATVCRFLGVDDTFVPPTLGRVYNPTRRVRSDRLRRLMLRLRIGKRLPWWLVRKLDLANRVEGYEPMDPQVRATLVEWFRPHNAELAELLGRDLTAWNR